MGEDGLLSGDHGRSRFGYWVISMIAPDSDNHTSRWLSFKRNVGTRLVIQGPSRSADSA